MNEHRDEIEAGVRLAFDPEPLEILEAFAHFLATLSRGRRVRVHFPCIAFVGADFPSAAQRRALNSLPNDILENLRT